MLLMLLFLALSALFLYLGIGLQRRVIFGKNAHYLVVSAYDSFCPREDRPMSKKDRYGYLHIDWNIAGKAVIVNLSFVRNILFQLAIVCFAFGLSYPLGNTILWPEVITGAAFTSLALWLYTAQQMPPRSKVMVRSCH